MKEQEIIFSEGNSDVFSISLKYDIDVCYPITLKSSELPGDINFKISEFDKFLVFLLKFRLGNIERPFDV